MAVPSGATAQNNQQQLHTRLGVKRAFVTTISYAGELPPHLTMTEKEAQRGENKRLTPTKQKMHNNVMGGGGREIKQPVPSNSQRLHVLGKPCPNK